MGKCYFNADWLSDERFSEWVLADNNDKSKFLCKICNQSYVVGYSGVKALIHHGDSIKHKKMKSLVSSNRSLNFFTPRVKTAIATPANQSDRSRSNCLSTSTCRSSSTPIEIVSGSNDQQPKLTLHTSTNDTLEAEIRWALYLISHHSSARDSDDIGSLFEVMFKDSQIAKTFRCSRSKLGYLVTFGIAPEVKSDILQEIEGASDYVLMFDESMNSDLQKKQLDIHIRYIGSDNLVKTKYIDSVFLEYAKARDIQRSLESTLAELGSVKLLQLAMDGPNVNWRVFKDLGKDIEMEKNVTLLNIGSCGLHVVHNSFKSGIVASEWDLASLLRSLYNLFNDAPTRKAEFLKLESTKSPLKFCGHRWLENVDVTERAIEIWPHIVKYIEEVKKGNLSNPSCASFKNVAEFERDAHIVAKLHSFLFIAKILKPFLTKFQGSEPLAPFFCSDLFGIVKRLYGLILKPSIFLQLNEYSDLVSPKDINKSNFKIHNSIDCGFSGL